MPSLGSPHFALTLFRPAAPCSLAYSGRRAALGANTPASPHAAPHLHRAPPSSPHSATRSILNVMSPFHRGRRGEPGVLSVITALANWGAPTHASHAPKSAATHTLCIGGAKPGRRGARCPPLMSPWHHPTCGTLTTPMHAPRCLPESPKMGPRVPQCSVPARPSRSSRAPVPGLLRGEPHHDGGDRTADRLPARSHLQRGPTPLPVPFPPFTAGSCLPGLGEAVGPWALPVLYLRVFCVP